MYDLRTCSCMYAYPRHLPGLVETGESAPLCSNRRRCSAAVKGRTGRFRVTLVPSAILDQGVAEMCTGGVSQPPATDCDWPVEQTADVQQCSVPASALPKTLPQVGHLSIAMLSHEGMPPAVAQTASSAVSCGCCILLRG